MGKSSKKKKRREKEKDLAKLRGVSLLDSENSAPGPRPSATSESKKQHHSGTIVQTKGSHDGEDNKNIAPLSASMESPSRARIEFVFPKAQGGAKMYTFDKQSKSRSGEGPFGATVEDGKTNGVKYKRPNETIDDILFPSKKRKFIAETESPSNCDPDKGKFAKVGSEYQKEVEKGNNASPEESHKQNEKTRQPQKVAQTPVMPQQGQISGRSVEEAVSDKQGMRPRANSTDAELMLPQGGLCDEQIVLQAHRWNVEQNYVHQIAPKGFVNLGNTCFLNATLQCLAYLPPFCQSLITLSEAKAKNASKGKQKQSQGQKITSILCSLFQKVHGFAGQSLREGSIAPQAIVRAVPTLGSCGSRNGYKFRPGRQEDAHEFLVHLLDAMHDGELRAAGINQHASGWRDRLPVSRLDETTFIHRIFGGYFRSQVCCSKCGYKSNTYDPFLDLSLEVSKKASNSVLYALSEFTRKETLDSANQWKCSGCKKYVCATKQLAVFRPPLSLCIQLKRFTFGGRMFSGFGSGGRKYGKGFGSGGGSKITKPIEFPADLDLPLSDGRSCAYSLTGIVIHVGGSASSGHYTAYVKKPGRKGEDQWYHADDSFVEPVSVKAVLQQKDAYLLFYCRKEVKLEFPAPPPRDMSAEEAKEFGRARAKARADSISAREESKIKVVEECGTPQGAVERVSTDIHPLATPARLASSTAFSAVNAPLPAKKNAEEATSTKNDSPKSNSRASYPTVSSSQLREYMTMQRLSEPPKVLLQKGNQAERLVGAYDYEQRKLDQSRSSADNSSSESTAAKELPASNDKMKSDSSSSDSASSTTGSRESNDAETKDHGEAQETRGLNKPEVTGGNESGTNSSPSEDDSSEESTKGEDREDHPRKAQANITSSTVVSKDPQRTRVVLSDSNSRAKVRLMLGPRRKKTWQSKTVSGSNTKGSGFELLGNMGVSKWDDEEDEGPTTSTKEYTASKERKQIVATIEKEERSRKRKMHLDRWDSVLDQGKTKKTKRGSETKDLYQTQTPKQNVFQRIQSGVQRMNKGKAKGFFRRKSKK